MKYFLPYSTFNNLLAGLNKLGYKCIGPQVENGAIVYNVLTDAAKLPWGMQDIQEPGKYRLKQTQTKEAFAFSNGAQAIKPLLFKSKETLWRVEKKQNGQLVFKEIEPEVEPIALIGARACDLAGMAVQDKTFIQDKYLDKRYQKQREKLFIVAVNCHYASANCFCVSTKTGPRVNKGYDLVLSEIHTGFIVESGSEQAKTLIKELSLSVATSEQITHAEERIMNAATMQTKRMPKNNSRELRDILLQNLNHERWDDVANRCLSCGNCTSVCPTCFCHHESETPDLKDVESEHQREWDSCFTDKHSYIHNKVIRDDTKSRYKQWLTHKLGTWWDQFDTSGCIGCGRCITWCPVGIDLTEEMAAIAGEENNL